MSALSTGRQRSETAAGLAFSAGRGGASLPVLSALTEGGHGSAVGTLGRTAPSSGGRVATQSTATEKVGAAPTPPSVSALMEGGAVGARDLHINNLKRRSSISPSVSAFTERSPNGLALVEDVGRARRRGTTGGPLPILLRGDPMAASEKRTPACELVERPRALTERGDPMPGVRGSAHGGELDQGESSLRSQPVPLSVSVRARPARPGAAMWRGQTGRAADSRVLPFRRGRPFPPRGGVRC